MDVRDGTIHDSELYGKIVHELLFFLKEFHDRKKKRDIIAALYLCLPSIV